MAKKKQIVNAYVRFDGRQQKPPGSKAQGPYVQKISGLVGARAIIKKTPNIP